MFADCRFVSIQLPEEGHGGILFSTVLVEELFFFVIVFEDGGMNYAYHILVLRIGW